MMRLPRLHGVALAAALVITILLTVIVRAPAALLGDWVEAHGKLRFIDASGTLWKGSALIAVSDGRRALLLPGRLSWNVRAESFLPWRIVIDLSHDALTSAFIVTAGAEGATFRAGRAHLPAAMLMALGAPFNTLRPGGSLDIEWSESHLRQGRFTGEAAVNWRDAQSALSTVAPLGSFRLQATGGGNEIRLQLQTLSGPLRLEGSGTLKAGKVSFRGNASADPEMRSALDGLLGVLGPRSGDNIRLALDT